MHVLAPLRTVLARHPLLYWIAVAACAAITANVAVGELRALDEARRSWGESRDVWVAVHDVLPGDTLVAEVRAVPAAVVPDRAVDSIAGGAVALQHVMRDEIITAADVGQGVISLLPHGWHGVAFAADETTISLTTGDHVSVVADGVVVVAEAIVIDVRDRSVTVGVPAADAATAALAARAQAAALTLRRP